MEREKKTWLFRRGRDIDGIVVTLNNSLNERSIWTVKKKSTSQSLDRDTNLVDSHVQQRLVLFSTLDHLKLSSFSFSSIHDCVHSTYLNRVDR